jgi:hypothetical protein
VIDGREQKVFRRAWELLNFVVMGNQLHLRLKTRRPDLGEGMQSCRTGYPIRSGRPWRRLGRLLQGRYRAAMIEDERPGFLTTKDAKSAKKNEI